MTGAELYEQILTLVTDHPEAARSLFRHLVAKADTLRRKLEGGPCGEDAPSDLLGRIDENVRWIREHTESNDRPMAEIARELKQLVGKVDQLERQSATIGRIVSQGAQMDFPWFHIRGDRNGHKCRQVEKVWWHLKRNPACTRSRAAEVTFVPDPLGYGNLSALLSACRRLQVDKYRNC